MVDYTIFIKTDGQTWKGFHHVLNADNVPRIGEYLTFMRDGIIYNGQKVTNVKYNIEFKSKEAEKKKISKTRIGTLKSIDVFVEGT
jgi:hypothetical protein